MARKKRKVEKKEEEYEWVPPEFDEKAFLLKDIKGTRALIVTVITCVAFAIVGYFVGIAVHWALGFAVLIAGIFLLRFIYPLAGVGKESLETKSMLGNYALFFLLFLGLWILFMNSPFSDHTNPSIGEPSIWVEVGGVWTELNDQNSQSLIHAGDPVNITSLVTDNGELSCVLIKVNLASETGVFVNMTLLESNTYEYNSTYSQGSYIFTIRAEDSAGNTSERVGSFLVNA